MSLQLTRRTFAAALAGAARAFGDSRPNILLVLSDDHSVPFLGAYGDPVIRTPNLDRFATEGMRFGRAFTAAPQCVPSRVALLTGRSPIAARMGRFSSPLPPDIVTLPELLRDTGYFTGICRRYFHLDGPISPGPETVAILDAHALRTFDRRVDYLDRESPPAETQAKVNGFFDRLPAGMPFFLWVNFNDPHHPWDRNAIPVPHDPKKVPIPKYLPDLPGVRQDLARHYDEIARMDLEFQSVLNILTQRGFSQNTIVVFMGDNGSAFPHGKGSLYDPGLQVPMLVRWPGFVQPGTSNRELVSGEDLTPTLLQAAGLTAPDYMSGMSFLPLLRGEAFLARSHVFASRLSHANMPYTATTASSGFDLSRCVRTAKYKLIYNCTPNQPYSPVDSAGEASWKQMVSANSAGKLAAQFTRAYFRKPRPVFELFNLDTDPGARHGSETQAVRASQNSSNSPFI